MTWNPSVFLPFSFRYAGKATCSEDFRVRHCYKWSPVLQIDFPSQFPSVPLPFCQGFQVPCQFGFPSMRGRLLRVVSEDEFPSLQIPSVFLPLSFRFPSVMQVKLMVGLLPGDSEGTAAIFSVSCSALMPTGRIRFIIKGDGTAYHAELEFYHWSVSPWAFIFMRSASPAATRVRKAGRCQAAGTKQTITTSVFQSK